MTKRSPKAQLQRRAVLAGVELAQESGRVRAVSLGAIAQAVGVSKQRLHSIQPVADWHKEIIGAAAVLDVWPILADMLTDKTLPQLALTPRQLKLVSDWLLQRGRANVEQ